MSTKLRDGIGRLRDNLTKLGRDQQLSRATLVILVFWSWLKRPEVAAAGWCVMAVGDGAATLFGRKWGRRKLPWNRRKSWAGFAAFVLTGVPATALLIWGISQRGEYSPVHLWRALLAAGVAVPFCAALESLPVRLDDNILVPFAGAGIVYLLTMGGT